MTLVPSVCFYICSFLFRVTGRSNVHHRDKACPPTPTHPVNSESPLRGSRSIPWEALTNTILLPTATSAREIKMKPSYPRHTHRYGWSSELPVSLASLCSLFEQSLSEIRDASLYIFQRKQGIMLWDIIGLITKGFFQRLLPNLQVQSPSVPVLKPQYPSNWWCLWRRSQLHRAPPPPQRINCYWSRTRHPRRGSWDVLCPPHKCSSFGSKNVGLLYIW